jgi:pimeloyl-ACP methyl ester carboxylesterase
VGSRGDAEGSFDGSAEHDRRRDVGVVIAEQSGPVCIGERSSCEPEAVVLFEVAPPLPPEDDRTFDQDDPADVGVHADIEERSEALVHGLERVIHVAHRVDEVVHDLLLDLDEHRLEQGDLVPELVVHRSLGERCGGCDLVDRGGIEPLEGEERAGCIHQRTPRRGRLVSLAHDAYPWYLIAYSKYATGGRGLLGEEHHVDTRSGRIRYVDVGEGEPIVFVHGVLADGQLWRRVVPLLADRCRCIVPDWPLGSHTVPLHPAADLSPPGLVQLVIDTLDALGLEQVTLVGSDTGGAICQMLVVEHPDRVSRLVLTPCDAYENFPPPVLFGPLKAAAAVPGGLLVLLQLLRLRALHRLPTSFGALMKRLDTSLTASWCAPARADRDVRRDLRKAVKGVAPHHTLEVAARFPDFEKPVLIAWPRRARFFPYRHAQRLAEDFPRSALKTVDDAYAFVSEDQPTVLADLIGDFMETHPRAPTD